MDTPVPLDRDHEYGSCDVCAWMYTFQRETYERVLERTQGKAAERGERFNHARSIHGIAAVFMVGELRKLGQHERPPLREPAPLSEWAKTTLPEELQLKLEDAERHSSFTGDGTLLMAALTAVKDWCDAHGVEIQPLIG